MIKTCVRCNESFEVDELGASLVHFVCRDCRLENQGWHWGTDITIEAMEAQLAVHDETEMTDPTSDRRD